MGWLEGIRRIYKPLRWLLVGFLLLLVAVPLLQQCVLGALQGKSCKWQPTWSFFTANYLWIVPLLLLLVLLLIISRRAKLHYEVRQRKEEHLRQEHEHQEGRFRQARERFNFDPLPANKLQPEDLGFHVLESSKSELEETLAQNQRPFHEHSYIPRKAVPYHLRGKEYAQPQYTEDELVKLLQDGKGIILQGPPTDGKSRTLYEIARNTGDYLIVSPKVGEVPTEEDIDLLFNGHKVVLLLDNLTNYVGAELNLEEVGKSLTRQQVSWVVASTCRDGPELESVRNAETNGLKNFYENIPTKLKLQQFSAEEKGRLAHNIGKRWEPGQSDSYPTPGSITMEEYKRYMRERFERDLSGQQQDTLRALKLLSRAGILPLTHRRIKALLEDEHLFGWRDFHLRRDCLDKLREYAFIGRPPAPEVVQPEPAYLADDVVTYVEGTEPEQDFDALMDVLEELKDDAGLFYLGHTYHTSLENEQKALEAYDVALEIRPNNVDALFNRGSVLDILGRHEEAIESYDAALEIRSDYVEFLVNKGFLLLRLDRKNEAMKSLCRAWHQRERLPDKGNLLANIFTTSGITPEECA